MLEGKMVSLQQGDRGAFCHLCHATRADANDPKLITNGFDITKDYASCKEAWDKLVAGDISYSSNERQVQCHENLAKADLQFLCTSLQTSIFGFSPEDSISPSRWAEGLE